MFFPAIPKWSPSPLLAPCVAQAVLLAVWALKPCAFFPLLFRWWAVFFWHENIGRKEMPRLWCWHGGEALLTSRLRAQRSLPLLIHFTWHLQYRHREATPPKGCSSKCGGQEGSAKMTQIPGRRCQNSYSFIPSCWSHFSPQRRVGGQESQEKGRCHWATQQQSWELFQQPGWNVPDPGLQGTAQMAP